MEKKRILIAEDEELIRRNLSDLLTRKGFEVAAYPDGQEALDAFDSGSFDLVITDLRMPVMGGKELLENVHSLEPDVPVIVLTGYGTLENAVECLAAGAFNFLCKPCTNEDLLKVVRRGIEHADHLRAQDDFAREASLSLRLAVDVEGEGEQAVLGAFRHVLERTPFRHDEYSLCVAVREAVSNALVHGNRGAPGKKVRVVVEVDPDWLRVRVEDEGDGFDWETCLRTAAERAPEEPYGKGLLQIVRRMDKVTYQNGGRVIVMERLASNLPQPKESDAPPEAGPDPAGS